MWCCAYDFPSQLNADSLSGTNGFQITSASYYFGGAIAGILDINNDGKLTSSLALTLQTLRTWYLAPVIFPRVLTPHS